MGASFLVGDLTFKKDLSFGYTLSCNRLIAGEVEVDKEISAEAFTIHEDELCEFISSCPSVVTIGVVCINNEQQMVVARQSDGTLLGLLKLECSSKLSYVGYSIPLVSNPGFQLCVIKLSYYIPASIGWYVSTMFKQFHVATIRASYSNA